MTRKTVLIVNSAAPVAHAGQVLQCLHLAVNKTLIRTELVNNRLHLVIPSYTLPDNVVMNGGLYPRTEIEANYKQLENTLAPLGHPVVNDVHVSATSPEAIAAFHVGAFNRNVQRRGNRVYVEKFVDVEYAANSEKGRQLLQAVGYDAETQTLTPTQTPIHTSVAVYTAKELTPNAEGYQWIARISKIDHDAILIGEPGAATPDQGVGMMVNAADAVTLKTNAGVLSDDSYNNRQQALNEGARKRWGDDAWIMDFDNSKAIVRREDKEPEAIGYTMTGGKVMFAEDGQAVKREESWVLNQLNRICQSLGLQVHSQTLKPETENPSPEADPMDKDELTAMLKEQAETLAANVAEALKPLGERLEKLETNALTLAANAEAPKREAVKAVLGELVANSLTGAALDEAFAKLQANTAAPLVPGFQANAADAVTGAPVVADYFNQ